MEIKKLEKNKESDKKDCYHLTRAIHAESIEKEGLGAKIGIRSTDGIGLEETSKVFFCESLEGTLQFINRNLNLFYKYVKSNSFNQFIGAFRDDSPELYQQIIDEKSYSEISVEDAKDITLDLGKLYLERGHYYKLNLKSCDKEEFEKMSDKEKNEIDYLNDDINEETKRKMPIYNMHTRVGRSVNVDQMALLETDDGKSTALDVVMKMCEYYKEMYNKQLPVMRSGDYADTNFLEDLYARVNQIDTQQLGKESVETLKDVELLDKVEKQQKEIEKENSKDNLKENDEERIR